MPSGREPTRTKFWCLCENFNFSPCDLDKLCAAQSVGRSPELFPAERGKRSSGQSQGGSQHYRRLLGLLPYLRLPSDQLLALQHTSLRVSLDHIDVAGKEVAEESLLKVCLISHTSGTSGSPED